MRSDARVKTPETVHRFLQNAEPQAAILRIDAEDYCRDRGEKQPLTPKEFAACLRTRECKSDHQGTARTE
jgi:hypothetical protein